MRLSFSCELDLFFVSSLLVNSHCSYDYSYCIKRFLLKNLVMEMCIHYIYPIYVLNSAKIFCIYKFVNIPKMKVIKEIERFRIIDKRQLIRCKQSQFEITRIIQNGHYQNFGIRGRNYLTRKYLDLFQKKKGL